PLMLAHPLDDAPAAAAAKSLDETAAQLGQDGRAYRRLFGAIVDGWPQLETSVLAPLRIPAHPLALARFGLKAIQAAEPLARRRFKTPGARALFAGIAAHGMLPLDMRPTAAFGLVLGAMAHAAGWVIPRGGAQSLTNALAAHLRSMGGEIA